MAIWIASSDFQGRFERKSWILESCLIKHCNFFQKYIHIDLSIMDKNISLHKYIFIYYVCMCCIYRIMGLESMVGDKVKNQRITCKNSMTLRVSSLSHGSDILMTHTEYPEIRRYKSTVIWFVYLSLNKNIYIYGSVSLGTPPPSYGIPPPCGVGGVVVVEVLVVRIRVVIVVEVEVVVGVQVEVEVVVIVLVLLVLRSSNVSSSSSRSTSRSVEVQVQVEVEVQVVVIQWY